jgi:hypothetical protein
MRAKPVSVPMCLERAQHRVYRPGEALDFGMADQNIQCVGGAATRPLITPKSVLVAASTPVTHFYDSTANRTAARNANVLLH